MASYTPLCTTVCDSFCTTIHDPLYTIFDHVEPSFRSKVYEQTFASKIVSLKREEKALPFLPGLPSNQREGTGSKWVPDSAGVLPQQGRHEDPHVCCTQKGTCTHFSIRNFKPHFAIYTAAVRTCAQFQIASINESEDREVWSFTQSHTNLLFCVCS